MRQWLIEKLGGFPDLDSAIARIRQTDDPRKHEILTEAVKRLFNAISADDILTEDAEGTWTFRGRPLTPPEVTQLKNEARAILGMKLWHVLKMDVSYQLSKKMFEEARTKEDFIWGQLTTWLFDVIHNRLRKMK